MLLGAGCASTTSGANRDGGTDAPTETVDGGRCASVTLAEACAQPERYDGCELDLHGPIVARTRGTLIGCTCCNAIQTSYVFECAGVDAGGPGFTSDIVLESDTSGIWRDVHGVVVDEGRTNNVIRSLIPTFHTALGCVGQDCFEVCAPAAPEQLLGARGRFVWEPPSSTMLYSRRRLVVSRLEYAVGAAAGGVVCTCCGVHVPLAAGATESQCAAGTCDPYCASLTDGGRDSL